MATPKLIDKDILKHYDAKMREYQSNTFATKEEVPNPEDDITSVLTSINECLDSCISLQNKS